MNYYDIDGNPMTFEQWSSTFKDMEYRRIGLDRLDVWTISTVWLGLDHNFGDEGPPLIFESMVFEKGESSAAPDDTVRYSTKEEAIAGHQRLVEIYRAVVQFHEK